jgi:hypothetical protein
VNPRELADKLLATIAFDRATSTLKLGGVGVSFHCDKFNTRILKNFEDVMGYEDGGMLIRTAAARTSFAFLSQFLTTPDIAPSFAAMDPSGRLETIFEIYKALAYGAIRVQDVARTSAVFVSDTSYLAEGWLENRERWHLDEREGPACHDKNSPRCEFHVEVI